MPTGIMDGGPTPATTYQICRIEENLIRITTFNKYMCNWTLEVRDVLKILWKRGEKFQQEGGTPDIDFQFDFDFKIWGVATNELQ